MKIKIKIKHLIYIIRNIRYHKAGRCNICGHYGIFLCVGKLDAARNSLVCLHCRSTSRNRHVASALLAVAGRKEKTIKSLSKNNTNISIYNTNAFECFYKQLRRMPKFIASLFYSDLEVGTEIKPNVFCQDLEKITFEDNSFDIVITEDVLEHIRHPENAFKEIYRVLKPGGSHIFTIPFFFDKPTLIRVDVSTDKDIFILPPEYHGDNIRDKILAYRTFGIDLFEELNTIGFATSVQFSTLQDSKYAIYSSFVFVSTKKG